MLDISFFVKAHGFRMAAEAGKIKREAAEGLLENYRDIYPTVYNIETTNACNMRCEMCPRTTRMTRRVETMPFELFERVVSQLMPHSEAQWEEWQRFVLANYGIGPHEQSENHFFLYVIPRVIQLHGYGDPLLDKQMGRRVRLLTANGFDSYFSCNPANIDLDRTAEMFDAGLTFIKYSVESVDDEAHARIRGKPSGWRKILDLFELKAKRNYQTTIVVTMLDLHRENQAEEFAKLREAFTGADVYLYLKSEDQQWYRGDRHGTRSVHWSEFCRHPWMSMTIKSNGEAAMCMEDYDNEIVLGDTRTETLYDIWNGERYRKFRRDHFALTPGLKCTERCDMKLIGELAR